MKILITGGNSFLAKELSFFWRDSRHQVFLTTRDTFNPASYYSVQNFFKNQEIDVLVHTAVKGGKKGCSDTIGDFSENLCMFNNLSLFQDKYKLMINFGSGAEFDRNQNISSAKEELIFDRSPVDYYGSAKVLISRSIVNKTTNIITLRLFGCFGRFEEKQRLFRSVANCLQNNNSPVIHRDKYMDYFYAQDVAKVIEYFMANIDHKFPKDINLCYKEKYKISELAEKIIELTGSKKSVIIENNEPANSYTGLNDRLENLKIDLIGLEEGIKECLINWNKS
jgi:UDP-glucose 4-epimerase